MMTPQEINIAIAEACGWKNVRPVVIKNVTCKGDDRTAGITSDNGWIPNYYEDLNAMHEAENVLTKDDLYKYTASFCFGGYNIGHCVKLACIATASQRCEAFLKTLGKWKE